MKRGNELCSFLNKVKATKSYRTNQTEIRAHEFEARNIPKQGFDLSGLLHPLFQKPWL
jgi:hypothetical protein